MGRQETVTLYLKCRWMQLHSVTTEQKHFNIPYWMTNNPVAHARNAIAFMVWSFSRAKGCLVVFVVGHSFTVRPHRQLLYKPGIWCTTFYPEPGFFATNLSAKPILWKFRTKLIQVIDCTHAYKIQEHLECRWVINQFTRIQRSW